MRTARPQYGKGERPMRQPLRVKPRGEEAIWIAAQEEAVRFHGLDTHEGGFSHEQRQAIAETARLIAARRGLVMPR